MIKKGQSVKVKAGKKDYTTEQYDISGWQGRVIDIEQDAEGVYIEVQWDSITLLNMPFEFIEESVIDDLEYEHYILLEQDLIVCEARDTEGEVHSAQAKINSQYFEVDEGEDI
jgi:hypothetical protein